jgi:hypothetical protein
MAKEWDPSRRRFLRCAACVPAAAGLSFSAGDVQAKTTAPSPSYLFAAKETARWIQSAERATPHGTLWLPEPDHPEKATTYFATPTLYTGTSGIVLFLIELGKATGDASYLDQARKGADHILATWQDVKTFQGPLQFKNSYLDFNHGLAGVAFTLYESSIAFNDQRYRDGALAITKLIVDSAEPAGAGVEWIGNPSPVVGDGSLVLYLIWAARAFGNQSYLDLAARAGKRFVETAEVEPQGTLKWNTVKNLFGPGDAYNPNYEGGTAGPAFVLARLYRETHDPQFLDAARKGARHLEALATVNGDSALLFYRSDLKNIFYLGYCSGPVGTARGFFELYQLTKEREYLDWTERLARGVTESGIPENLTPGLWNVVCQCCGNAGIIDFFTGLWVATHKTEYLVFAKRVADQTISRATNLDGRGYRWYQAWTRVKPWEVTAETGYFIGGSGVGSALLHLHTAEQKQYAPIVFPDSPFLAAKV